MKVDHWLFTVQDNVSVGMSYPPEPRYEVEIAPNLHYQVVTQPNAWHRFWARVLLGWTWRELE